MSSGIVLYQSYRPAAPRALDPTPILTQAITGATSMVVVGAPLWVPPLLVYLWRYRCKSRRQKALLVLLAIVIVLYPHRRWSAFRRSKLWDAWLRYLHVKVVSEVPLERGGGAGSPGKVYALAPHGIFPFTIAVPLMGAVESLIFKGAVPVCASIVLRIPVLRQVVLWLGAVEATPAPMAAALDAGDSLAVCPGGIAEMFKEPRDGRETILLRNRKGFVRVAIQAGAELVPVFTFGASRLLRKLPLPAALEGLSRRLQMSLILFFGRFGLPVPFQRQLLFALGRPIKTAPNPSPSQAEVDAVHAEVMAAMERLFETYKHEYGWGDRKLEIV